MKDLTSLETSCRTCGVGGVPKRILGWKLKFFRSAKYGAPLKPLAASHTNAI